jgi:hypothetical protein
MPRGTSLSISMQSLTNSGSWTGEYRLNNGWAISDFIVVTERAQGQFSRNQVVNKLIWRNCVYARLEKWDVRRHVTDGQCMMILNRFGTLLERRSCLDLWRTNYVTQISPSNTTSQQWKRRSAGLPVCCPAIRLVKSASLARTVSRQVIP